MKNCPICGQNSGPYWHCARNVSDREKSLHFIFVGCLHAEAWGNPDKRRWSAPVIPQSACADFEARWDAYAEMLFAEYTALWTPPQRDAFRAKLWPTPSVVVPTELFDRYKDEAPKTIGSVLDDEGSF